jgi:hypothetical protein
LILKLNVLQELFPFKSYFPLRWACWVHFHAKFNENNTLILFP